MEDSLHNRKYCVLFQVYDTADGSVIQPLSGHSAIVYCVDYAKDGTGVSFLFFEHCCLVTAMVIIIIVNT